MKIQTAFAAFLIVAFTPINPLLPTVVTGQDKVEEVKEAKEDVKKAAHYSHTSSKGRTYYLFSREQELKNSDKVITMYYFAKDPNNSKGKPVAEVPEDRLVSETKNGLLVLKKKK